MTPEEKEIQVNIIGVIETAMSFRGITISKLAASCSLSNGYLNRVFNCKEKMNFILLAKIQKALNIKFEVRAIQ